MHRTNNKSGNLSLLAFLVKQVAVEGRDEDDSIKYLLIVVLTVHIPIHHIRVANASDSRAECGIPLGRILRRFSGLNSW